MGLYQTPKLLDPLSLDVGFLVFKNAWSTFPKAQYSRVIPVQALLLYGQSSQPPAYCYHTAISHPQPTTYPASLRHTTTLSMTQSLTCPSRCIQGFLQLPQMSQMAPLHSQLLEQTYPHCLPPMKNVAFHSEPHILSALPVSFLRKDFPSQL